MDKAVSRRPDEPTQRPFRSRIRQSRSVERRRRRRGNTVRGKEWFWEPAGTAIFDTALAKPDVSLLVDGREIVASPLGQFVTEADAWQADGAGLTLDYRLKFLLPSRDGGELRSVIVRVRRKIAPLTVGAGQATSGFVQELSLSGVPTGARLRLRFFSPTVAARTARSANGRTLHLGDRFGSRIVLVEPTEARFADDGETITTSETRNRDVRVGLLLRVRGARRPLSGNAAAAGYGE